MKKEQKEQISGILKVLEKAHRVIKKNIEKNNIQPMLGLLEDCQETAIAIGSRIEKTEGVGFSTVALLEEYCELTYQIHEEIQQKLIEANEVFDHLSDLLTMIADSVQNDIKVRKEVVFLPYKASMWDSLESVWMAADDDPDCDAYVVPIPYFDRNSDGSFGEKHYEGNLYPKYVPVTPYEEFDLEEHKPDMIFIHNPYDEYNRVTSVHPEYYAKKLRQYTEQLVYIPYFVRDEIQRDNISEIEKMKHFCNLPGVLYAHKVIVQSEEMKQIYVDVLTNERRIQEKEYWEQKILGLGSPKIDKVCNSAKEDFVIPEEWKVLIQKKDGGYKKIVLYNTHLSLVMSAYGYKFLDKLQNVFHIFRERIDIVLLWRPHPLTIQTIKSMNPAILKDYERIVNDFKREKWGIYDDSSDLNRAIAISDAYYGSMGSVYALYKKTGKPMLVQNVNVL